MNAPLDHSHLEAQPFDAELRKAHTWRGECIQQFADLELIVAEALECMASAKPSMKVKRGELVRAAFDELKRVIGTKGAIAKNYGLSRSLVEIDRLIEWRAHLTHGLLSIWRGKAGQWLFTLEHRDPGGGPVRMHALPRRQAEQFLRELAEEVERFRSRVRNLRNDHPPKSV